ncbi:MAG TPA: TonB-dependent receptor [Azospirillaceae bacterium]|nr:TonB-dependent receptor [Azospirillaceae bacterium]
MPYAAARRRLFGPTASALIALSFIAAPAVAAETSKAETSKAGAKKAGTPAAAKQAPGTYNFAIPAKPLGQALEDFGRVTGLSVIYADKAAAAAPAPALSGGMSAEEALKRLTAGSGATYRFVNPTTVTVETPVAPVVGGDALQLGPVVVSASGHATALRDAPASISVIDSKEFEKRPVRDLTEVLSRVEGVTLRRAGNLRNIQIRGFDSNYVLSMVDGKRVDTTTSVFRGNDYDTGWVNGDAIERVEVVRGPMSSLYGSDAVGGVVNVITKKPGDKWIGSVNGGYTFQEDRNAGDSWKTGFYAAGPIAPTLGAKIYGAYDRRLGDEDVNPPAANGTRQPGVNDSRNANINGELVWSPDARTDVTLDGGFSERSHADSQTILRQSYGVSYKGGFDFGSIEAKAYGDRIRNLDGNISGQKNPNTSTNQAADIKAVVPVNLWGQTLSFGGDVRRSTLEDPSTIVGLPGTASYRATDTEEVSQYSLFVEDEIVITDDLRLTFGNRYDHHEMFGGHNSPRAYLVYHLTDAITLKTGWSKAFKAPTLLQTSTNWGSVSCGSATVGCYIIGNPDLKPETSISKEIGLSADFGKYGGGFTLFRNDLKDMVDITSRTANRTLARSYSNFVGYLPDGRPIFEYQNIAKARTQGVEANLFFEPANGVMVRANYTYLDATNRSGSTSLPLVYRSRHTANASVDWEIDERWSAFFTASYIGSQYVSVPSNGVNKIKQDGFATFDIGGAYKLTDNVTVTAGVINIADKEVKRTNTSEFNEEGRRYFITATTRF